MILPPLYYGMHRFQTLLRKRQQTLCLRSFLNDAVTACDPQKRKGKKINKPKRYRKARFHREEKCQLWIPGWVGVRAGGRGKDGCVERKRQPSCFSASGEHEHTGLKHTAAVSFGSTWKPQCR